MSRPAQEFDVAFATLLVVATLFLILLSLSEINKTLKRLVPPTEQVETVGGGDK